MLDLKELWLFALLGVTALWFWRAQGIREIALRATLQHCVGEEVSLLDQTVALRRIGLRRDNALRLRLWRRYQFEFTVTGGERYRGHTDMLGMNVSKITLPPHRFVSTPDDRRLH